MGTPEFSVPVLQALVDAGHDVVAAYTQPPRRAGRGKALTPSPGPGPGRGIGDRRQDAGVAPRRCGQGGICCAGRRCRRRGGLWPDPAQDRARCARLRLPQRPRLAVAAVARRGADPARDPGGRRRDRGRHHADGGRARYRAGAARGADADRRQDGGRIDAGVERDGRAADGRGAGGYRRPPGRRASPKTASPMRPRSTRPRRGSISIATPPRSSGTCGRFNPVPGAFFEVDGERIRVLAAEIEAGAGAPGIVLDDDLAIACRRGAIRPTLLQRAGRGVMTSAELLRGFPIAAGTPLA